MGSRVLPLVHNVQAPGIAEIHDNDCMIVNAEATLTGRAEIYMTFVQSCICMGSTVNHLAKSK